MLTKLSVWIATFNLMMVYLMLTAALVSLGQPKFYPPDRPTPLNPSHYPDCALIISSQKEKPIDEDEEYPSAGYKYLSNYVPSLRRSLYEYQGHICITYEDVNEAVQEAKYSLGGHVPEEIYKLSSDLPKPDHISIPAEILTEATRILAKWFGLSYEAILYGLPRVDTSKTIIKDICPAFLQPVKCEVSRYRTLTGMCNNLEYPSWGSARSAMIRFIPPAYADGISEPKTYTSDGYDLPSPRLVSFVLHHDISEHDRHLTFLLVAWGQMVDHDMTLAASTVDELNMDVECCKYPEEHRHPNCMPISIPDNDPFYKFFRKQCMDFTRVQPGLKPGCPLGPRCQINTISAFLDANFVYGSSQEIASRLREYRGGRLKSSPLYRDLGLKDLLPMKTVEPDIGCAARPRNLYCFDAGDERVNEQLQLTVMHTLFMREHNRIAEALAYINPHWDDETLYQETRRIVIAEVQHITFNEFLPIIIGKETMRRYGLDLLDEGYYDGYSPKVNAGIRVAFQAAVFRFGHSLLPDVTERYNKFHEKLEAIRLSMLLRQPYELYKPGIVDTFIHGLINQEPNRMDPEVTTEVTNHLFEKPGERYGMDLASLNVQRAREMGLPGYNKFREYCGIPKLYSFHDLIGTMSNKTIHRYAKIYRNVDDIDLWSAGISEYPLPGAVLGPTFACLIGEQFANIRRGDRFWYENKGWPSSFTPKQLQELRRASAARILCDNADDLGTIQLYPMVSADPASNPRVYCQEIPVVDLSKWKDTGYHKK